MKRLSWIMAVMALGVLLAFAMGGCGSGAGEAPAEGEGADMAQEEGADRTQEEIATAAGWCEEVLNDPSMTDGYPYYRLLDIDQDGTDELFLSSTEGAFIGAEDRAKLIACVDGEAMMLMEIGGVAGESFSYDPADHSLFYYSRLSGEEHIVQYQYENGLLSELQTSDQYDEFHDPETGDNPDDTYYLNGEQVAEEAAEALWDQFDDRAEAITYSTDGNGSPYADDDED